MFLCTKLLRKVYKGQRYYHICNNLNELGAIKFQKRFKSQIKAKLCINAESATHKMFLLCGKLHKFHFFANHLSWHRIWYMMQLRLFFSRRLGYWYWWIESKSLIQYTIFYMFSMKYGPFASQKWLMAGSTLFYKFFYVYALVYVSKSMTSNFQTPRDHKRRR